MSSDSRTPVSQSVRVITEPRSFKELIALANTFDRIGPIEVRASNGPQTHGNLAEEVLGMGDYYGAAKPDSGIGFELKTSKGSSHVSLFSKSPHREILGGRELVHEFAGDEEYPTLCHDFSMNTAHSSAGLKATLTENSLDIIDDRDRPDNPPLEVGKESQQITHRSLSKGDLIARYNLDRLITTATRKFSHLLHMNVAEGETDFGGLTFDFYDPKIYTDFKPEKFVELLEDGTIKYSIRMGYRESNDGKWKDNGPAFRIHESDIEALYGTVKPTDEVEVSELSPPAQQTLGAHDVDPRLKPCSPTMQKKYPNATMDLF